jgi:hypothetical protein
MPVDVQVMGVIMAGVFAASSVWALVIFKLKKTELESRGSDPELGAAVERLRHDLTEVQERLDFAERLLTAGRASQDDKGK